MSSSPSLGAGLLTLESGYPGAPLTPNASLADAQAFVGEAERLGFSHVWVGERRGAWTGHCSSAVVAIGGLLAESSGIAIASASVGVAGRPVDELVGEAHRLAVSSAGRFELGVVSSLQLDPSVDSEPADRTSQELLDRWKSLYPRVVLWVSAGDPQAVTRAAQAGARIILPSFLTREEVRSLTDMYGKNFRNGDQPVVAVIRDCCLDRQDLAFIREVYTEELLSRPSQVPADSTGNDLLDRLLQRVACGDPAEIADQLAGDAQDGVDHIVIRTAFGGRADLEPLRWMASQARLRGWLCEPSYL